MEWWAETDRLACVDANGVPVELVVRQRVSEREEGLVFGPPRYVTTDGEAAERIDGERSG